MATIDAIAPSFGERVMGFSLRQLRGKGCAGPHGEPNCAVITHNNGGQPIGFSRVRRGRRPRRRSCGARPINPTRGNDVREIFRMCRLIGAIEYMWVRFLLLPGIWFTCAKP